MSPERMAIELSRYQVEQIVKLIEERGYSTFVVRTSGGECGCVYLVSRRDKLSWRIDIQGRVQGGVTDRSMNRSGGGDTP